MRHRKQGRALSRNASHRRAMLANLATAVLEQEKVKTTTAKAKEARGLVERLITVAKRNDLHARRQVLKTVRNQSVVTKLFDTIAPRFIDRPGGYTRIIHLGQRQGDAAELSILELVGSEAVADTETVETQETKPRSGRRKKTEAAPVAVEPAVEEAVVEEIVDTPEETEEVEAVVEETVEGVVETVEETEAEAVEEATEEAPEAEAVEEAEEAVAEEVEEPAEETEAPEVEAAETAVEEVESAEVAEEAVAEEVVEEAAEEEAPEEPEASAAPVEETPAEEEPEAEVPETDEPKEDVDGDKKKKKE